MNGTLHIGPYLVPLLVIALVARRLIRNKPQKVKHGRLFILPALLAAAAVLTLSETPFPGVFWIAAYIVAAALGAGIGYLTSHHREFTLDAETNEIMARATPVGSIIFAALFAVRYGLKLLFPELSGGQAYGSPAALHHPAGDVIGWTDAGLVFSAAMILATAVTTWLRTRHLAAARKTRSSLPPQKTESLPPD